MNALRLGTQERRTCVCSCGYGQWSTCEGSVCPSNGIIDDLRLWDHARSAEDIAATMSCRLIGDEPGLLAYWSFETGGLTDDSGNGHDGVAEEAGDAVNFVAPQVSLPGCSPQ
jgi:hypothetical protein